MTRLLLVLFLWGGLYAESTSLQARWEQAQPGDYVVTEQEGHYSLLWIRSCDKSRFLVEVITLPTAGVNLKTMRWEKWVAERAPGHTSWVLYALQRPSGKLLRCFSLSTQGWVTLSPQEQFFTRLLSLPLEAVPDAERKRIGAPPQEEESDRRPLWNPPLVIEGKKQPRTRCAAYQGLWTEPGPLEGCRVALYFSDALPRFPFPCWLEVHSAHYHFQSRALDSGRGLCSPFPLPRVEL